MPTIRSGEVLLTDKTRHLVTSACEFLNQHPTGWSLFESYLTLINIRIDAHERSRDV
jgi:hypothetical protein